MQQTFLRRRSFNTQWCQGVCEVRARRAVTAWPWCPCACQWQYHRARGAEGVTLVVAGLLANHTSSFTAWQALRARLRYSALPKVVLPLLLRRCWLQVVALSWVGAAQQRFACRA